MTVFKTLDLHIPHVECALFIQCGHLPAFGVRRSLIDLLKAVEQVKESAVQHHFSGRLLRPRSFSICSIAAPRLPAFGLGDRAAAGSRRWGRSLVFGGPWPRRCGRPCCGAASGRR